VAQTRQLCTFYLDETFYGIDVERVQEIIRYHPTTRVPLAPTGIHGLLNLRGQIVTAIDLRKRLRMSPPDHDRMPMNLVVRASMDEPVSLLVDRVGDVVEVTSSSFEPAPETLTGVSRELVLGAYKLDIGLLLLLNVDRTVSIAAEAA
jgi:purine-binding chemotaxis protein CheW